MNAFEQFAHQLKQFNEPQLSKIRELYESDKELGAEDSPELLARFFNEAFSSYLDKYHPADRPAEDECSDELFDSFMAYFTEQQVAKPAPTYLAMIDYFLHTALQKPPALPPEIVTEHLESLRERVLKNVNVKNTSLKEIENEVQDYINNHEQDLRQEVFKSIAEHYNNRIQEIQRLEAALSALNKDIEKAAGAYDVLSMEEINLQESLDRLNEAAPGLAVRVDEAPSALLRQFLVLNKILFNSLLEETRLELEDEELHDVTHEKHFISRRLSSLLDKADVSQEGAYTNLAQLERIDFKRLKTDLIQAITAREESHDALSAALKDKQAEVRSLEETVKSRSSYVDRLKMDKLSLQRELAEMEEANFERYSALERQHETQVSQNKRLEKDLAQLRQV